MRLLRFRQDGCAPCSRVAPFVTALAAKAAIDADTVDVDLNPDLAELYGIRSVPAFVVLGDDGQPVYTGVGAGCLPELARILMAG